MYVHVWFALFLGGYKTTVNVENLKTLVIKNATKSDRIIIISGFATPDTIEEIAKLGINTVFYYGMYRKRGLTKFTYEKLCYLDNKYPNLKVKIVCDYHVHTKCYLFLNSDTVSNALVGSANCSIDGLMSGPYSEMLVELNKAVLKDESYLQNLLEYAEIIDKASVSCGDKKIIITSISEIKIKSGKRGQYPQSSNPYIAFMPLYSREKINGSYKDVVNKKSGLNWGLQSGHAKKGEGYAEAYIKVTSELIDAHPIVFPFFPQERRTTTGKITRRYDPVTVLWDDGEIMEMVFSGTGVERPTKAQRRDGEPFHQFPKQFTSGKDDDGGGARLGEYLRRRMNVSERHLITLKDLKDYGRECIVLKFIHEGYYEADFSGKRFTITRD